MLRISLIIAILAGIAALAISQLKVAKKIESLTSDLESTRQNLTASQAAEAKAKKDAREATAAADKAKKELDAAKTDLAAASEKADQQEKRANDLEKRLTETTQQRNDAQAELARWKAFEKSIEDIRQIIADNKKLVGENDGLKAEAKVLNRKVNVLQAELANFTEPGRKVPLPPGLKGKVIAVDPKYEFVVLNVGESDNVLKGGEMLVNRSGRLVAKIRILSVDSNRCIANVLPEWKHGEIMEGDVVMVGL
jgi:predicted nuclease with TOPRIM domain